MKVLDVCRRPYDAAFPVVCMEETPRQLIGEPRKLAPVCEDNDYRRVGTCNVLMAAEPWPGGA